MQNSLVAIEKIILLQAKEHDLRKALKTKQQEQRRKEQSLQNTSNFPNFSVRCRSILKAFRTAFVY